MQSRIVHPNELGVTEHDTWRNLLRTDPALWSPFLTPRFASVIGRQRPTTRVAVLEDGPAIVAFLGFETDSERVGWPLGGGMSDAQAFVAAPGFECDVAALVRQMGLCVWKFDHLAPAQKPFEPYGYVLRPSPVIDLSGGHEAYLDETRKRSKDVLAQTGRRRRKLEREHGPVTVEWHSPSADDLATLIEWKSAQYRRTEVQDLLAPDWAKRVLHELAIDAPEEDCAGLLATVRVDGRMIAAHFGLARGSALSWWFPAYDPDYGKYSPGLILLLALAEAAGEHGIETIDLGPGASDYKLRVANDSYEVGRGSVPAQGLLYRAAIRARHPGWVPRKLRSLVGR